MINRQEVDSKMAPLDRAERKRFEIWYNDHWGVELVPASRFTCHKGCRPIRLPGAAIMNVEELTRLAMEAYNAGHKMTLVLPSPWKGRPKGFPRGELLSEQIGSSVYHFEPIKILNWLRKNELQPE